MSAAQSPTAVRLLRDLIAIPSVNPAFLPAGDARAGEKSIAEFIAAIGKKAGLDVEFQKVLPNRSNVLLRFSPSAAAQRRIVLAPHVDTVGSIDGSDEIFRPQVRGDRIWGRGACDTKGSVAAMLGALFAVASARTRPRNTEITFAGLVDEEVGQLGSRAWVKAGGRADLAVVGEPTRLIPVTAHKGDVWARLVTSGKAAHGACPDKGRNAVLEMARVVQALEGEYAEMLRERTHPLLGHATINVGSIRGGSQPNIVPDRCAMEIDRRTLPGETEASVKRGILQFLRRLNLRVQFENVKSAPCPPLETNADLPVVGEFLRGIGRSEPEGVHYFCDAAVIAGGGTPCVVFGPGDIAQAHTAREWISVASLERGERMLRRYLETLP